MAFVKEKFKTVKTSKHWNSPTTIGRREAREPLVKISADFETENREVRRAVPKSKQTPPRIEW
jgi:hypothetical protein